MKQIAHSLQGNRVLGQLLELFNEHPFPWSPAAGHNNVKLACCKLAPFQLDDIPACIQATAPLNGRPESGGLSLR
ncbi:hypothetical protein PQR37_37440 [Paraburkholderia nemoris]|uniref:hypothetical protein n=1 Tax=Paraburkholderia nemoris TaxID=2793076 RepID=UPI0038B9D066